ncbi:MAG: HEAT repeat domain-containing protein [Candidatus Omnitrophota bacterium]
MKKIFLALSVCAFTLLSGNAPIACSETGDPSRIVVCSEIFNALGKTAGASKEAAAILAGALTDKDFFIRASAAKSLGLLGDKDSALMLKKLAGDENYLVMINATAALVHLGLSGEDALLDLLKDNRSEVRGNVLGVLTTFKDQHPDVILEMLRDEKNDFVREQALLRLGENKFIQAQEVVIADTENKDPGVRQAACFALGQIGGPEAGKFLHKRLSDDDPRVRARAKEALSVIGDRSIISLLWQDVKERNAFLRGSSYVALANLKEFDVLPLVLKEIISPDSTSHARAKAAEALVVLRPHVSELSTKALSSLNIGSLSSDNLEISFDYKIGGQSLTMTLIAAINDVKSPLHQDAPLVITIMGLMDCLPALHQALLMGDPDMAASAASALGEMKDSSATEYLIQACKKYGCGKI